MLLAELIGRFLVPLNTLDIEYMVTGAVAAIVYGEPRLTHDLDLVLHLDDGQAHALAGAFPAEEFYVPPVETILQELARSRHGHFNLLHHESAFRADVYLRGEDPLQRWGLARRRRESLDGLTIWLAPIEYVILRKLELVRDGIVRHQEDIRAMIRVSGGMIDRAELESWLGRLRLGGTWDGVSRQG